MDDELVLFTSYFNLVGGRRQDTADTFRVDPNLSSPSSPDGMATLYVVTEASMGGHMGPRARRLAADVVAWEYASHGEDPPTARLKAALQAADEAVRGEFDGHVAVGMSVIAVERDSIYLGQAAPAQVYVLHDGSLHSISASADGSSPFVGALGANSGAQISVFRDQIAPDDIVTLCASWFHRAVDAEELRECFGAGTADDIAEALLDLAKQHAVRDATVIVIEVTLASELALEAAEDEPPTLMEQVDTAVQALADVGRMLLSELRAHPESYEHNGRSGEHDGSSSRPWSPIRDILGSSGPRRRPKPERPPSGGAAPETAPVQSREVSTPAAARPAPADPAPVTPDEGRQGARPAARETVTAKEPQIGAAIARSEPATRWVPPPPAAHRPAATTQLAPAEAPEEQESAAQPLNDQATEEVPIVSSDGARDQPAAEAVLPEPPSTPPAPAVERKPEPPAESELERVNSRIQNTPDLGDIIPPVQTFPDTSTEPERIYATSKDIQAVNRRPRRFGGIVRPGGRDPLAGPTVVRPPLSDLDLSRPASRPAPPAVIWFSIAVVMVLAALALYKLFPRHHPVLANPYPQKFQRNLASAVVAKTSPQQDHYLNLAKQDIALAQKNGSLPKQILSFQLQWQMTSDNLHHIARERAPLLLSNFGQFPNAQPTAIAASPSMVLVLDAGRKSVFSVRPYSTSNPDLVVQDGESDSGFTVGMPTQVATDGSSLLILDEHNVLVRDAAGTKTATSLAQPTQTPEKVVAMGSLDPDVYLLDVANGQLWRYPAAVSAFSPPPAGYFTPPTASTPNLSHAVSFAFDQSALYILQGDGTVQKFDLQANPQQFTIHLHTPLNKPVSIFTEPGLNYVWIADPANGRILQLDKSGGFVRAFRSGTSAMDFHHILSLAISPDGRLMYVLCGSTTGGKLFQFPVPLH